MLCFEALLVWIDESVNDGPGPISLLKWFHWIKTWNCFLLYWAKCRFWGHFLTLVRVLMCIILASEMMPTLFFSSFPPLSQHGPHSTRTSVWASYHVRCCVHRQISQVQKSMQDLGLFHYLGKSSVQLKKKKQTKKVPLIRLENKSWSVLLQNWFRTVPPPCMHWTSRTCGVAKNPTTTKSNHTRFQNKLQRQNKP